LNPPASSQSAGAVPSSATWHIEISSVTKQFGATLALSDVSLGVERASIHALVGENGAGKSTLGKIISGVYSPDAGHVDIDGVTVSMHAPHDALRHGITAVAQELSLVPARSVIENVFLGIEDTRHGVVRSRHLRRRYDELVEGVGFSVPADILVRTLALADQYKVELLRAVARDARLIVLDEPTAALGQADTEMMLDVMRTLRERGTTIIFISHFLEDVLAVSDRVTVLRDGRVIETIPAAEATPTELVTRMLGRSLGATFPPRATLDPGAPVRYAIKGLRTTQLEDIDLEVRVGEILALAGLVGSGRTEIARAIFGVDPRLAGDVWVDGKEVTINSPRDALRAGITMLPENRKTEGLVMCRSVEENVTLPLLGEMSTLGVLQRGRERAAALRGIKSVGVQPPRPTLRADGLSGGNQQKVLFARSLLRTPRLLVVDEPTRGIDVGAKRGIYQLLHQHAAAGVAILLISSEMDEVLALAHRVLVVRAGRITAELNDDQITEDNITRAAFGVNAGNSTPIASADKEHSR
jgi:simple sugar transport system ATP-binding protein/ribose transport system ATP-binding protein